jgi:hypothetical protein
MTCSHLRRSFLCLLLVLLAHAGLTGTSWGQKPVPPVQPNPLAPVLRPAFPLGMQRGTTLDLTLTGTNLNEPTGLWTSFPAKVTIPPEGNNGKEPTKLLVRLQVPADAPIGFHTIRLATTRGMSNFRTFCIDDLPQVLRNGTNRARNMAQEVPVPCVVAGTIGAEVSDWYKIKAQAGQRVSFEVLGRRLGSAVDPQLTLHDVKTGKELPNGHSNDAPGLQTDPRLTYVFKEAGEYLIEIRDVAYRGAEDFHYRLRIGDFPCCTTPLPMAARRGSKVTVTFAGPAAESAQPVPVQAPTDPAVSFLVVAPRGSNGLHGWPVTLALSDIDEVLEQEPNNELAKANKLPVPGAVTGRLQEKNDQDYFVFPGKKGQRLIIEAETTELGSPTEVYVVLRDAKGNQIQATNPAAAPRLDFTPTADGDYFLSVEHLHLWGGPAETYRLSVVPYEPGFDLSVGIDRYDIAPGGTHAIPILVARAGYTGPIEVGVLGPAGLGGQLTIPANQPAQPNQPGGTLNLTAGPSMAPGPHTFLIQGKATINGKAVTRFASVRALVSRDMAMLPVPPHSLEHQLGLAVTEKPVFTLAAKLDSPQAMPGKPIMLTVTATRVPGFTAEIALALAGLPGNVTAMVKPIPAGQNEVKIPINPAANAAVGQFTLGLTGTAKHNGRDYLNKISVPLVIKK